MGDVEVTAHDPIALELFKNAIFSIADEMALTVFRTTYSGVLKDNMDYSTGFADANGKLAAQGLTLPGHLGSDRKSTRLNSSHSDRSRMPSSA